MSEPVHITTMVEDAKARLISQFKNKTKIEGMVGAITLETQTLDDVLWDLYTLRNFDSSTTDYLNTIGEIVGASRNGMSDADYRIRIIAKIGQNTSKGTGETIISIFNLLTTSLKSHLLTFYPATIMLYADHDISALDTDDIYDFTQLVCAAGVKLMPLAWYDSDDGAFGFEDDPDALGFGDLNDPTVGGNFASLV
jgi:hypothetical protein